MNNLINRKNYIQRLEKLKDELPQNNSGIILLKFGRGCASSVISKQVLPAKLRLNSNLFKPIDK
jgi:hypothetical protein